MKMEPILRIFTPKEKLKAANKALEIAKIVIVDNELERDINLSALFLLLFSLEKEEKIDIASSYINFKGNFEKLE